MGSRQYSNMRYLPSATENSLCSRTDRKCTRQRADGQKYCIRHLPVEKDSAFRRCNYISHRTSRRCSSLLLKADSAKEGFCIDHARLVTQVRRHAGHKNRYKDTPETLIQSVQHYVQFSAGQSRLPKEDFRDAIGRGSNKSHRPAIDYYSESSEEDESKESLAKGFPLFSEEIDADIDDSDEPLRHAGTFTTEEISIMARDKLIKLQGLYTEYFKVLAAKMRHRTAKFRTRAARERQLYGSGFSTAGTSYKDEKKLKELRALRRYHRHFGTSDLLRQEAQKRRRKAAGLSTDEAVSVVCSWSGAQEEKCNETALPKTQFCFNHMLGDDKQLLFSACDKKGCDRVVFPVGKSVSCWIHTSIPNTKAAISIIDEPEDELPANQTNTNKPTSLGPPVNPSQVQPITTTAQQTLPQQQSSSALSTSTPVVAEQEHAYMKL